MASHFNYLFLIKVNTFNHDFDSIGKKILIKSESQKKDSDKLLS